MLALQDDILSRLVLSMDWQQLRAWAILYKGSRVLHPTLFVQVAEVHRLVFPESSMHSGNEALAPAVLGACLDCAASNGFVQVAPALLRVAGAEWTVDRSAEAARGGHLSMVQWALATGQPCHWDARLFRLAAAGGHLALLQWARSPDRAAPCACDTTAYAAAIRAGHPGVLQWLCAIEQPRVWNWFCNQAAVCSTDEVVLWMATRAHFWYPEVCDRAAGVGNLGLLRVLHGNGARWGARGIHAAVTGGHLEVLQWMYTQDTDAPWDPELGSAAASAGQLPVLQWLCAHSPAMHYSLRRAAFKGHLHVLQWAHAQGRALSLDRVVYTGPAASH